jgi:hypothetical protein
VLALGFAALSCDGDPGFGNGLDSGKMADGACTEYPNKDQAWAMNTVVPPSHFDGEPKDLDLDTIWCQKSSVKSLFFILGYPT